MRFDIKVVDTKAGLLYQKQNEEVDFQQRRESINVNWLHCYRSVDPTMHKSQGIVCTILLQSFAFHYIAETVVA